MGHILAISGPTGLHVILNKYNGREQCDYFFFQHQHAFHHKLWALGLTITFLLKIIIIIINTYLNLVLFPFEK